MLSERFPENVMAQSLAAVQVTFGTLRELTKNSPTNVFKTLFFRASCRERPLFSQLAASVDVQPGSHRTA
jgi:hypothetical protein